MLYINTISGNSKSMVDMVNNGASKLVERDNLCIMVVDYLKQHAGKVEYHQIH